MTDRSTRVLRLLDSEGARLHALLTQITLRNDVGDDLLQELFLRLVRTPWLPDDTRLPAYARRAAMRLAFDWRRRRRRDRTTSADELHTVSTEPRTGVGPEFDEQLERVVTAMGRLPRLARDAVALRYLELQSFDEIGQTLGRTAKQARALCAKGLGQLRRDLTRAD